MDQSHTRLRALTQTCKFADIDFEIERQIMVGGLSSKIRKSALKHPMYDLASMLSNGQRDERSKYQNKHMESNMGQSQPSRRNKQNRASQNKKEML